MLNPDPKPPARPSKPRKPLRRTRSAPRKAITRDAAYLRRVSELPCCRPPVLIGPDASCEGPMHAHHAGKRPGVGRKAADDTAIPLCSRHHAQWHEASGVFRYWTRDDRRRWASAAIEDTREALASL
jgi:hypothetical protein